MVWRRHSYTFALGLLGHAVCTVLGTLCMQDMLIAVSAVSTRFNQHSLLSKLRVWGWLSLLLSELAQMSSRRFRRNLHKGHQEALLFTLPICNPICA